MKLRELMSTPVVRIHPEENVAVAARLLAHYNIGAVPVCGSDGRLKGMLTDRDIVTRCLAAGRKPSATRVEEVMTAGIIAVRPDMDAVTAAELMGSRQIRRLPVMENGRLCGMVSLADLSRKEETCTEAADALTGISSNLSSRE